MEYKWILYNTCYGGFGLTDYFIDEFNKQYPNKKIKDSDFYNVQSRADEDLFNLVCALGKNNCQDDYCNLSAKPFMNELIDYVQITEYDGQERIYINREKFDAKFLKDMMENCKDNFEEYKKKYYNFYELLDKQKELKNLKSPLEESESEKKLNNII